MSVRITPYAEMLIERSEVRRRAREQEANEKAQQSPPPPAPPSDEFNAANLLRILNE